MHFLGGRDDGDNTRFGGGTIKSTEYERNTYGAGYGFKAGDHEFGLDYQRLDVRDTGTPSLPMDVGFTEADRVNGRYATVWKSIQLKTKLYYSNVDHRMNNFELRRTPDFCQLAAAFCAGDDRRLVDAESEALGYRFTADLRLWGGDLRLGADGELAGHEATVRDPDAGAFFVTNFNDAQTDTFGFFSQWRKVFSQNWELQLGVRYHRVEMNADRVDAYPAQLADQGLGGMPARMVQMLRDRFNGANRSQTNNNVDWTAELGYQMNPALRWTLAVARKVRSPYYIERYLWIPLEVNAGLGDANNYVGNVDLDPEVSRQVEFGFDWQTEVGYVSPGLYYRSVNDYIQGTPVSDPVVAAVSANAAGDPTPLQFNNVDAEIYGFDVDFGYRLLPHWRIDGVASFVRGKRRDINDNLFRMAPPTLRLTLTHERARWFATVESVLVYRQENISQTNTRDPQNPNNSNEEVPGYILANLYGQYRFPAQGASFTVGINNLFDTNYVNPLGGVNRVLNSDVPQGQRLPGPGRNVFASLRYEF